MIDSPIKQTMDEMFGKLAAALLAKVEAEKQISEYTVALRALAKVMEDKDEGDAYLARLDAMSGKPGFGEAIRTALRVTKKALTPVEVKAWIRMGKTMDLSAYSNPMASIHTTLRRMKKAGEVEEVLNEKGEKAYQSVAGRGRLTPPPRP
jgi:hypothetical protein